ncbi:hypothetical protein CS053_01470 [Rhodanobacter glycinis]|uniref:GPI inositol-deacylase PGAP1-like alpha/beta domain-containing protein n=1 Tax=Rhodanobacter glycinis TaxID=582702 RepID=A0A5B9DW35_9GAMM|nr:hypothetical protein [Rhodanobacter glycinis]QEE23314.1 hypothetical protein CS053_01470 [Rhodanobacter glycinis]
MTKETTQPLSQQSTPEGGVSASARLTSTDDKTRGSMVVPPTTVVPVIFVPGIMGSNLKDAKTGESIWNVNSTVSILLQWIFRSAKTRQSKLVASQVAVDDRGGWYGKSATVPDEKTGKARGQGTTSKTSYGDFVQWLDNHLTDHAEATADGVPSPWRPYEDKDFKDQWHAEKTFQALTTAASGKVWDNFYCPVHVVGYNWLQSNGDSGKFLAKKINDIIEQWDGKSQPNGPTLHCEQVILVSHSMGGFVTRAAVHPKFGNVADKVLGIVHGENPANGAAAAYHHCRSGYGGVSGLVLGRNAAQVTAVFANSPGAMELLPNQQYPAGWLKVRVGDNSAPVIQLPQSDPYAEIYSKKDPWWRLTDPKLIDPSGRVKDPWATYLHGIDSTSTFHYTLGTFYHPQTYVHYGADAKKHPVYGDLAWHSDAASGVDTPMLLIASPTSGSNPVKVRPVGSQELQFNIMDPDSIGYPQPGDGTVPACSGEAPFKQGGGNVRQSFRLTGFDHQDAYKDVTVQHATLYAVGMLLQQAKVL